MKIKCFLLAVLISSNVFASNNSTIQTVNVLEVGLSMNTNRVFILTDQELTHSSCSDKQYLSVPLPNPAAYLFYSVTQAAMNEGKPIRVRYSNNECINNGAVVEVFWSLNE
ncbi:hypothetical protein [Saccharospirillum sp. MSK14-1]|uniref:hypothetical protein n=1 Tax=Saccharospirillum sp. MSK14-1 TaxID=1897632 RepID=UPI0011B25ECD|nr:hypothetical protein [Saccharospirillum sp. MSK14-1]